MPADHPRSAATRLGLAAAAGVALARLGPAPATWRAAVTGRDLAAGLDAVAAAAGCALVGLVVAGVGLGLLSRVPGALGRGAAAAGRRVLPSVLRGLVASAVSAPLLAATGVASASGPAVPAPGAAARSAVPPTAAAAAAIPVLDRAPLLSAAVPAERPAAPVVVTAGDSLWRIAARQLGPHAPAALVARTWPAWFAANRGVVGPDPDLIRPGQRLVPPPASPDPLSP